ncbi:histidine phosphatase family protein [Deinococcus koreensis]|uniref:Histidine phosphatase family protein n=1 Tax=Deinococcus koreensis TaxID=2054903 RepID=A0A2K3UY84_9DEIO|nr:histidine phosphatase family protein [Deinococcus koreensis]PNY81494.1 histidine phosphatase family protein [Deinococcus koreensis]
MTSLHLTFLRHGRSRADDENVHEGSYDSPLSAEGRAQAAALAAYWQAHPPQFDRAYCSTLLRAHETATIVTGAIGVPLTPTDLLREWDNGPLAGMNREEAERRYPMPAFRHDLDAFTAEGGESQAAIRARALSALELIWQGGGERVLVVSHGGFSNSMLRELLRTDRGWFEFDDTSFTTLRLSRATHTAFVSGVNRSPHLPGG